MPVPTGTAGRTIPLRGVVVAWPESRSGNAIDQAEDYWIIECSGFLGGPKNACLTYICGGKSV